jgi:hypothetical protein
MIIQSSWAQLGACRALLKGGYILVGQLDAASQLGEGRTQAKPFGRANGGFEDGADFGFGTAAVQRRTYSKCTMNFIG